MPGDVFSSWTEEVQTEDVVKHLKLKRGDDEDLAAECRDIFLVDVCNSLNTLCLQGPMTAKPVISDP